jgi:8-oxo-dGTP diphosphatase
VPSCGRAGLSTNSARMLNRQRLRPERGAKSPRALKNADPMVDVKSSPTELPMPSDREYSARPIVGVGAVILVGPAEAGAMGWPTPLKSAGVVLVKRLFEPLAGKWSLPGGTLEVGETLASGVAREITEETGLTVDVGPIVEVFDRIFRDEDSRVRYHFVLIDYVCRAMGGRLRPGSDVGDVTIADPDDLAPFALTAITEDVIRKALSVASNRPPESGSHTMTKE